MEPVNHPELQNDNSEIEHYSSCAVYNEPAYPKGKCDCGGYRPGYLPDGKGGFIPDNNNYSLPDQKDCILDELENIAPK